VVRENPAFTAEYYAADKRYIGNAVEVFFRGGGASQRVQVDFPIGHSKRRAEGMPVLVRKFESSVEAHYDAGQSRAIRGLFRDVGQLDAMPVQDFVTALVKQ
jgi:2-methylcitrate dehydratase